MSLPKLDREGLRGRIEFCQKKLREFQDKEIQISLETEFIKAYLTACILLYEAEYGQLTDIKLDRKELKRSFVFENIDMGNLLGAK